MDQPTVNRDMFPECCEKEQQRGKIQLQDPQITPLSTQFAAAVFGSDLTVRAPKIAHDAKKNQQWKQTANYVKQKIDSYGHCTCFHGSGSWESTNAGCIPQQNFQKKGNSFHLLCLPCKDKGIFSPILDATLMDEGAMKINHLYFHDKDCCSSNNTIPTIDKLGCAFVRFDPTEILGDTYQGCIHELNQYNHKQNKFPPGQRINFGYKNRYGQSDPPDDRTYELLPSKHYEKHLDQAKHNAAMMRLFYHICCNLNLTAHMAPYHFKPQRREKGKRDKFVLHETLNVSGFLFMNGISLIFGAHNLRQDAEPSDQPMHFDFASILLAKRSSDGSLQITFPPGSVLLPLTTDGRSIFMFSSHQTVNLEFGEYCYFSGSLPHGGKTMEYAQTSWQPAIHIHIDNIQIKRREDSVVIDVRNHGIQDEHLLELEGQQRRDKIAQLEASLSTLRLACSSNEKVSSFLAAAKDISTIIDHLSKNKDTLTPTQKSQVTKSLNTTLGALKGFKDE